MVYVYKLPPGLPPDQLKEVVKVEGGEVCPIQDADGNWIISEQEWVMPEYQGFKHEYPEIAAQFTRIPWNPPPPPPETIK